jgi:hypothetical protein
VSQAAAGVPKSGCRILWEKRELMPIPPVFLGFILLPISSYVVSLGHTREEIRL